MTRTGSYVSRVAGVTGFLLWGALAAAAGLAQAPVSAVNAANAREIGMHVEPATFRTNVVKNTAGLTMQARPGGYASQHAGQLFDPSGGERTEGLMMTACNGAVRIP